MYNLGNRILDFRYKVKIVDILNKIFILENKLKVYFCNVYLNVGIIV